MHHWWLAIKVRPHEIYIYLTLKHFIAFLILSSHYVTSQLAENMEQKE